MLHRGLANEGARSRPIAYGVCSTGWARDTANYPPLRAQHAAARLPAEDAAARRRLRRAYAAAFPGWDEERSAPVWASQRQAERAAAFLRSQTS